MVKHLHKNERGVALLAVLVGIALMTLIVVDFAMTSGLGFVSAANQINEMRAGYLSRSAVNIGLGLLAADARADQQANPPIDSLSDPWAVPFPAMQVGGGTVNMTIIDEDRKINLNAMVGQNGQPNPLAIAKVQRLFLVLNVNPDLIQGILAWITPNGANGTSSIGDYYLGLRPPYQPRYGPMPTIGDLQMVQGFNEALFNRVAPFLTTMPTTAVNVNTAPPQVLAALEPQMMEDQQLVQEIVQERAIRPFSQTTDIINMFGTSAPPTLSQDIEMHSTYFTINGMGTYAGARKIINASFARAANGIGTLVAWHED